MSPAIVGWASSLILLATLVAQTRKLYRSETTRGVSKWLYVGELAASCGFATYSWLLHNRVYFVANLLGVATAVAGLLIYARNRRRERRTRSDTGASAPSRLPAPSCPAID